MRPRLGDVVLQNFKEIAAFQRIFKFMELVDRSKRRVGGNPSCEAIHNEH